MENQDIELGAGKGLNAEAEELSRSQLPVAQPERRTRGAWDRIRSNRTALVLLILLGIVILAAIFGPVLYSVDPARPDYAAINSAPSLKHPLGADNLGRDTLARLLQGLRVSLLVALVVESINIFVGATVGLLAGHFGGWIDNLLSRIADMLFAFPGLLLAILVAAIWGAEVAARYGGVGRLLLTATALSLVSWPLMARLVRSETLSLRERDFILAARSMGATDYRIIRRHLLPNLVGLIITAATLDVVSVIVNEAVLSLLGLGTEPPMASIGRMITDAVPFFTRSAFQVFVPSVTLMLLVVLFSLLGDSLRDVLDPYSAD